MALCHRYSLAPKLEFNLLPARFTFARMKNEKAYAVPLEGSLGLLALGADGLRAWRKRKAEAEEIKTKPRENHG